MKLICPGCGSVASAETWLNDALCRETLLAVVKLPSPLPQATLGYLSLFRPGKQALTWKKAKRLVTEITALVATDHVQVQGKVARPCSPRIWSQAMEQMNEQRNGLSLPMPSHIYLRKVAWDLADREDAGHGYSSNSNSRMYQEPDTSSPVNTLISGMFKTVDQRPEPENKEMCLERKNIIARMAAKEITPEEAALEHENLTQKYGEQNGSHTR